MKKEEDFVMGLSIYMACLREKKRYTTAKRYQDALNSIKCFCGIEAIQYTYINRNRLLCYQSWLLDKGRSLNTVSTYMRRIRHIYNLAVEANEAPFVPNLFKDVFTGVESKRKKALPREMLDRIFNAPLEDPSLRRVQLTVRLMFAFSGIAFVDLTHLKWENIKCYWDRYKITPELLQYIETNSDQLTFLENQCLIEVFAEELITSTIDESAFEKLLPQLELEFDIPIEKVERQKVGILIKKKYIPFDVNKYGEIKDAILIYVQILFCIIKRNIWK